VLAAGTAWVCRVELGTVGALALKFWGLLSEKYPRAWSQKPKTRDLHRKRRIATSLATSHLFSPACGLVPRVYPHNRPFAPHLVEKETYRWFFNCSFGVANQYLEPQLEAEGDGYWSLNYLTFTGLPRSFEGLPSCASARGRGIHTGASHPRCPMFWTILRRCVGIMIGR
jgi:hypothetical protein